MDNNKIADVQYKAILVDTSVFKNYGLKLEAGLLNKLCQFKDTDIQYLLPDVIKNELHKHLHNDTTSSYNELKKSFNEARHHIFLDYSQINYFRVVMSNIDTDQITKNRIEEFIKNTGASVIKCSDYLETQQLLNLYFANKPPFSEKGKKKNEFPDAMVLLAVDEWAKQNSIQVLAVSQDNDWLEYCKTSEHIDCLKELSDALSRFHTELAPREFLSKLTLAIKNNEAEVFLNQVRNHMEGCFKDYSDIVDARVEVSSEFYFEQDAIFAEFYDFELRDSKFKIIKYDEGVITISATANITLEITGEFSLYAHDGLDKDYVYLSDTSETVEETFSSEILITIYDYLEQDLSDIEIEEIEIVDSIDFVDFGELELPDDF